MQGTKDRLIEKLKSLDYVQTFQDAERELYADQVLWKQYEQMKDLQKMAVLYQKLGKRKAFRETAFQAQRLEKGLKETPLVQDYSQRMQDVSDLLQYITQTIEYKINDALKTGG